MILELVLNLKEVFFRVKNEPLQFGFQVLQVWIIFEGKLNHLTWIVYLLVFVEKIKSFKVFTFFVANNSLSGSLVLKCSAKCHGLSVSTITFHQYLGLTWEIFTLLIMAKLRTKVPAVLSFFVTSFSTGVSFMCLLASSSVALQTALVSTCQGLLTKVEA